MPVRGPLYLRLAGKARTVRARPPRLPTHRTVKVGGRRTRQPVAYFWKDVIGAGSFIHPVTGQRFRVTPGRIDAWVRRYQRMRRAGIEVPTPVDHSDRAEDNRGFVVGARRVGDRLQLLHQVVGHDGVKLAMRNRCSVYIDPNFVDERGREWGEVIAHSAYTPKPVISGQGEFVPFAASRAAGAGRSRKVPVFYLPRSSAVKRTTRRAKLMLSKAVDPVDPAFEVDDEVTLEDGTTATVLEAVDATAYRLDVDGEEQWQIEDNLTAAGDDEGDDEQVQLSRGRTMKRTKKKNGKTSLSPKQVKKARKLLNIEDDVEISDAEILQRLLSQSKLSKAVRAGLDDDDEEDEDDVDLDEEEDDEDGDDEDDDDDVDEDEEGDDADDDEDEEGDEDKDDEDDDVDDRARSRKRLLAKRRKRKVRELAGTALSRVPSGADAATLALLKRSLKTERRAAVKAGAITPDVDDAIAKLLFTKGKPNGLALSRMAGSDDPLAFRLYEILRRNKPVPVNGNGRTGSQAVALSRRTPGKKGDEAAELKDLQREVRKLVRSGNKKKD